MTWKTTGKSNWVATSGATLEAWEADALVEGVGVCPFGEGVGLGEVCPASWTCLVKTREERDVAETKGSTDKSRFKSYHTVDFMS